MLIAPERRHPSHSAAELHAALPPKLATAVAAMRRHWSGVPRVAIILGTGLGHLAEMIDAEAVISYREIPGLPHSTALAHKGQFVCGRLAGVPVIALQGRCHLYEGYCFEELTFSTQIVAALGAKQLIVSNAAGGMNPQFRTGDVMVIDDHINLMFKMPPLPEGVKTGIPDCSDRLGIPCPARYYYDRQLIDDALEIARRENIVLQRGVYVGVTGPNYETRAEYRMFRRLGGDAVGMSTVPEVLTATHCGMRVLGFSAITNVAKPDAPDIVDAQEVVDVAECAAPKMQRIILRLLGG
jgi:purine-nucleoside phosphorylase